MSVFVVQVVTGFLIGAGLWFLGLYVGLGVREDREADRHAKVALARIAAQQARTVYLMAPPPPAGFISANDGVQAGWPVPFPRAGRLALGHPASIDMEAPEFPHDPGPRPITSPVDLAGAVRIMCLDAEQYVANLLAATYHAEKGHPW